MTSPATSPATPPATSPAAPDPAPQQTDANGITVAYRTHGDPAGPPVLLVHGLGMQLVGWPQGLLDALTGRGLYLLTFDNRDVGESTHLSAAPPPDVMAAFTGDTSSASYRLEDMADDAAALLDALGLDSVHVLGVSMGGMLAQTLAIRHPARVRSLTAVMSTTGDRSVGGATQAAIGALLAAPAADRAGRLEQTVATWRVIRSPGFETDESEVRARAAEAYDRSYDPVGVARQAVAIQASGDRTARLAEVTVPTLVIHGEQDPLVNVSGGRAIAAAVPGAQLMVIDGMGHDLPAGLWPRLAEAVAGIVAKGEAARG